MGQLIILMGPTGAGKSTQGDMLAEFLGGVHLSSGKILRRDAAMSAMISDGSLAPAADVERMVGDAIDEVPENMPIVLDGFPRTMSNVHWLEHDLADHHRALKHVVLLELDVETSLKRLGVRDRADDAPDAVRAKWKLFEEQTAPVVAHYEAAGLLRRIDGRGTPEQVQEAIERAVS